MNNCIPIIDCLNIDFSSITEKREIVALHETGHLIAMYALDLMKFFNGIDIIKRDGLLGLTDMAPNFANEMQDYANYFATLAGRINQSGEVLNAFISAQYLQGMKLYLPHICRLFAGGSITRYYGISADYLCQKDRTYIFDILRQYQLDNQIDKIQSLIDQFLKGIFSYYDTLIKAIYKNLLENEQLSVDDVNFIIDKWKSGYPNFV